MMPIDIRATPTQTPVPRRRARRTAVRPSGKTIAYSTARAPLSGARPLRRRRIRAAKATASSVTLAARSACGYTRRVSLG